MSKWAVTGKSDYRSRFLDVQAAKMIDFFPNRHGASIWSTGDGVEFWQNADSALDLKKDDVDQRRFKKQNSYYNSGHEWL